MTVTWGRKELKNLIEKKVVIIRALSFEWIRQMFLMSPDKGRRLWFELLSFSSPHPYIDSPFCQKKDSSLESFYTLDYYEVPTLLSYSDYLTLLNFVNFSLTDAGYTCYNHVATAEEIKLHLPNGVVGGLVSRPQEVDNFRSFLPIEIPGSDFVLLDETPQSIFTLPYTTEVKEDDDSGI